MPCPCLGNGSELFSEHYAYESHEENFSVKPPTAVFKVVKVEFEAFEHLFHCIRVSVIESGIRCNARTNLVKVLITRVVLNDLLDIVFALGPRAHKNHIAYKHII